MKQAVNIYWNLIEAGGMPNESGTYLVAFDDGTVESYPMEDDDIVTGQIRAGRTRGVYWSEPIPHPDS
jgi:hypothetical protein